MTAVQDVTKLTDADVFTPKEQPATHTDPLLRMLEATLINPDLDVEKMERVYALYEQSQARQAKIDFAADLAAMQGVLPVIDEKGQIKNNGGQVQSTYAKWADIKATLQPFMSEYGFGITHEVSQGDKGITVTGRLSHRAGHERTDSITLPHDSSGSKNSVQAVGSSNMYGRRYTAQNLIGFTTNKDKADDGGEAAPGDGPMITDAQQEELKALCHDAEIDIKKFLGYFEIKSFAQIPQRKFDEIRGVIEVRALEARAKRQRAKLDAEAAEKGGDA